MRRTRWFVGVVCAAVALGAGAALAAPDRTERGPITVSPGTKDGNSGYWVNYRVYTLRDFTADLADLLSFNGRATKLSGVPTTPSTPGSSYDNKEVEFDRDIDFAAIDEVLGNPSYVGEHGNKRHWIRDYAVDTGSGFKITDRGCTASSLLEAGRLARIYKLLAAGVVPTASRLSGYHVAWYSDYSYTIPFTKEAVLQKLREVFALGIDTYSPIVLDLNHDGKIGVTGRSTAAMRKPKNAYVAAGSVLFDLRGFGEKRRYEWLSGDGDGFLVYDRTGTVARAAETGAEIDGKALFGNAVGYDNGFQKLALYTGGIDVAGRELSAVPARVYDRQAATGSELAHLRVWIDSNRDARPQRGELFTLEALGITEVGLEPRFARNRDGETVIQGHFVQGGKRYLTEDVWFAEEPRPGQTNQRRP